ncbi:hypothetical protein FRC03_006372 [Tulasnella sp. 419]|nr:hypothetical protein FRC03_006372 [Tulasnella sp. 419]
MSSSQPPDERRNNKRQMSLNTSMQIPGIIQPSGLIVNKRPRPELSTPDRNNTIANAPGDLVARLVELGQQVAELGLPIFSAVITTVGDVVSTIKEEKDHEIMIEEICDLCDQIAVRIIQPLKEGMVTGIIENMIQSLMGGLQAIVGEYNHMTAEARHYPHLLDNISTKFLESLSHTLRKSVNIYELAISNEHTDTLDVVQRINARTITIEQMVSSTERMFREYTSNNRKCRT